MRLDNDPAKQRQSSPRSFSNGSSRSPGPRTGVSRVSNGDALNGSEHNGAPPPSSYTNGSAVSRQRPTTFYGHDRTEVTRLLIQGLTDLGYHTAAAALSKESGCELEGPTVAAFRSAVLKGRWNEAETILFGDPALERDGGIGLDGLGGFGKASTKPPRQSWSNGTTSGGLALSAGVDRDELKFCLRQQKYLELLERRDLNGALMVLQQELTALHHDEARLRTLSSLMMCQSAEELKSQARWDGAQGDSRSHLLSQLSRSISPSIMIPEHRLAHLLDQVKQNWITNCLYHNTEATPSLYVDHTCSRDDFPLYCVKQFQDHKDEVFYLQYSHDGTRLATSSKDGTIIIYDTEELKPIKVLDEHESEVNFLAWSPDDTMLVSCSSGQEACARIWDVQTGRCTGFLDSFTHAVTTAAWDPDGESFVLGSHDLAHPLSLWTKTGIKIHDWPAEKDMRVNDVAMAPDGTRLVVLLIPNRIWVYDYVTKERIGDWIVDDVALTSVTISKDCQHMLISMADSKIRLMEIDTGDVIQRYDGHVQNKYVIRSSFGGANESFVVSGSEDSRIYIWRSNSLGSDTGRVIEELDAHPGGCVNAVAWHPKNPRVFASAGDDRIVRIWKSANEAGG